MIVSDIRYWKRVYLIGPETDMSSQMALNVVVIIFSLVIMVSRRGDILTLLPSHLSPCW